MAYKPLRVSVECSFLNEKEQHVDTFCKENEESHPLPQTLLDFIFFGYVFFYFWGHFGENLRNISVVLNWPHYALLKYLSLREYKIVHQQILLISKDVNKIALIFIKTLKVYYLQNLTGLLYILIHRKQKFAQTIPTRLFTAQFSLRHQYVSICVCSLRQLHRKWKCCCWKLWKRWN